MKILIADDESGITEVIESAVRRRGLTADVAHDGPTTLELIQKNEYNLAFLDFTMPEMTGVELCESLKKKSPAAKVVLVTAYPFILDDFIKAVGIDELLPKPFRLDEVDAILKKYV